MSSLSIRHSKIIFACVLSLEPAWLDRHLQKNNFSFPTFLSLMTDVLLIYLPKDLCLIIQRYARPHCVLLLGLGSPLDDTSLASFFPFCQEVINVSSEPIPFLENLKGPTILPFSVSEKEFHCIRKAAMVGLRLLHVFDRYVETWGWGRESECLSDIFFVIPVVSGVYDDGQLVLDGQWEAKAISLSSAGIYTVPSHKGSVLCPTVVIYSFSNLSQFHFLKDMNKKEREEVQSMQKTRNNLVVQVRGKHQPCSFATWTSKTALLLAEIRRIQDKLTETRLELNLLLHNS